MSCFGKTATDKYQGEKQAADDADENIGFFICVICG